MLDSAVAELGNKIARLQLAEIEERHGKERRDGTGRPVEHAAAAEHELVQQVVGWWGGGGEMVVVRWWYNVAARAVGARFKVR